MKKCNCDTCRRGDLFVKCESCGVSGNGLFIPISQIEIIGKAIVAHLKKHKTRKK